MPLRSLQWPRDEFSLRCCGSREHCLDRGHCARWVEPRRRVVRPQHHRGAVVDLRRRSHRLLGDDDEPFRRAIVGVSPPQCGQARDSPVAGSHDVRSARAAGPRPLLDPGVDRDDSASHGCGFLGGNGTIAEISVAKATAREIEATNCTRTTDGQIVIYDVRRRGAFNGQLDAARQSITFSRKLRGRAKQRFTLQVDTADEARLRIGREKGRTTTGVSTLTMRRGAVLHGCLARINSAAVLQGD